MKIENFIAHIVPPHFPLCRAMHDHSASSYGKARMGGVICFNRRKGFTLIEVIITLVIVAILATMMYSYFGSSITQSGMPVVRLGKAMDLQTVMENITADYKSLYNGSTSTFDIATLQTHIAAAGYYAVSPAIPYTVVDNDYIKFDLSSCASSNCLEQNDTDSSNPYYHKYLKVTVKGNTGETLTVLFSK